MAKQLTEEKVLKKLGIEDFRHLTKAKVIDLASMLDQMDPEVAKKALEQFPFFAETTKAMMLEYKEVITEGIKKNDESVQNVYNSYNILLNALQNELNKDELTFEDKKYIIEQMKDISDKINEKDTENKKFLIGMTAIIGVAAFSLVASMASALGGKTHVEAIDSDEKEI